MRNVRSFLVAVACIVVALSASSPAHAVSPDVVISQVYGGGGNSGATLTHDFVELFNRGSSTVDLTNWSIQYASATGTTWQVTVLSGSIAPEQHYLVQEAQGTGGTTALPTPNATGTIMMSATAGKVALVNNSTTLTGSCPATVVDFAGYGTTANCFEGSGPAPAPSNTTADLRGANGCTETDNNAADFAVGSPNPRNIASPVTPCAAPQVVPIHVIQGATHRSPLEGQAVSGVQGIVTALRTNGFYMQDPNPDADDATSEGIFVFTSSAPTVALGDSLSVGGNVVEFRAGGATSTNLTITEITSPVVTVQSSGNPLPGPIVVGAGGRTPPAEVIEDDATGDVETSGVFDPGADGIDFYESLESMRVQVNNPVAVGPTNDFGEIPVLADDGAGASVRTARGGVVIRPSDFNPERIHLDDTVTSGSTPSVNVGDHFTGPAFGVLDYSFGNFKLFLTSALTAVSGGLVQETTVAPTAAQVGIGTLNVENLDPGDPVSKFDALAAQIVTNMRVPDIVALEEVQDNNGPTNDSITDASATLNMLISRITAAAGPSYAFAQIDPVDDQDGGEPGGNIRVAFLYRTDRGLSFVSNPGGSTTPNSVGPTGLQYNPGRIDPANTAFNASRKPLAAEFLFNGVKLFLIANHFNSKGGDQPLFGRFQPPTLSSEAQRNQQAQVVNTFVDDILAAHPTAQIVVLGDFNDFEFSTPLQTLKGGVLADLVETLPQNERYSYVFEGNSQTLDHILVSNHVSARSPGYDIVHANSEFAAGVTDHEPQVMRYSPAAAPTAIRASSLTATRTARGTLLRWRTGSEVGTLGFHVYRAKGLKRLRVSRAMIRARGGLGGSSYRFVDRTARPGSAARYWLQEVRADGSRRWHRFAAVRVPAR